MMSSDRWHAAQKYEKAWWKSVQDDFDAGFYKDYAEELENNIYGILPVSKETRILEIGSGAAGILTHIPADFRYAIDPLENYYSSIKKFTTFRDNKVKYFQGKAEALPFKDNDFHLIIIDNVLDHCEDIDRVFQEMSRVLKKDGIVYLRSNLYTAWGKIIRWLVEILKIDPGHPHTFSKRDLTRYFRQNFLEVVKIKDRGYFRTWLAEIFSFKFKETLKAVTLSTPNKTLIILKK